MLLTLFYSKRIVLASVPDITKLTLLFGGITYGFGLILADVSPVNVIDKYPPVAFRIVQKYPAFAVTTLVPLAGNAIEVNPELLI